jgi:hypothetical protein
MDLVVKEGVPSCFLHDQVLQAKDYVTALSSIQSPIALEEKLRKTNIP